ncbi:MAG: hypothetical protein ACKOB1_13705, partial [Planctomycetia bacterium]
MASQIHSGTRKPAAPPKPPAAPAPAPAPPPAAAAAPADESPAELPRRSSASGILRTAPAWAVSMLLHIVILLSMALIVQEPPKEEKPRVIVSTAPEVVEEFEEFEEQPLEPQPEAQEVSESV